MSDKVYAVKYKNGTVKIISKPWNEAKKEIQGIKGVVYKGFTTTIEAEKWLTNSTIKHKDEPSGILKIYVDGSYTSGAKKAGWGFVAVKNDTVVHEDCGSVSAFVESRNIAGECFAAIMALKWLNNKEPAELIHDYAGLATWLTGDWSAKRPIAVFYVKNCQGLFDNITFVKIKGHSENKWNDRADALAWAGAQK